MESSNHAKSEPNSEQLRLAIVTGGCRGIGAGISEVLASCEEYDGLLLTYNTNKEAAESHRQKLLSRHGCGHLKKVEIVGGDLTTTEARDRIFDCVDKEFISARYEISTVVHNAGQYVGISSDNVEGLTAGPVLKFGSGALLDNKDKVLDISLMEYYQKLYGTAFIDICERSLERMKVSHKEHSESKQEKKYRGSIIGISSPGCNSSFKVSPGYDIPGSGKCIMEYSIRLYALEAAKYGINCNVIIPGFTRSDAWGKIAETRGKTREEFLDMIVAARVPMKEVIEANDIGDTVRFLAGNGGGRFMTGLSLRVDGGTHLS